MTPEEETEGPDMGEHGNVAYPDFRIPALNDGVEMGRIPA